MVTQTEPSGVQLPGHQWKDPERVRDYVAQSDRDAEERAQQFALMTGLTPFEQDARLRILDIGSGHGIVAAAFLDAFPNATAIGLDLSDAMMEEGRRRMAGYGERFRYHVGDFGDGGFPADLQGPFEIIVSSRAIHHLTSESKQRFYREIYQQLADGGCFMNLDNMRPRDEFVQERYRAFENQERIARGEEPRPMRRGPGGHREFADPANEQVEWLRQAGFAHVDVPWKRLTRALIVGYK